MQFKFLFRMISFLILMIYSITTFAEAYLVFPHQPVYNKHCLVTKPMHSHKSYSHKRTHGRSYARVIEYGFPAFSVAPKKSWHARIKSSHSSRYNPDQQTGDDLAIVYPEMNIDQ